MRANAKGKVEADRGQGRGRGRGPRAVDLLTRAIFSPTPGGFALLFLTITALTGFLLIFYYRPSSAEAYTSVLFLLNDVTLGWLIHGVHKWAADLFIASVMLHLIWSYFKGDYKTPPQRLPWALAVLGLLIALALGFSGQILAWDQNGFWLVETVRERLSQIPLFGSPLLAFAWGGTDTQGSTLLRFYGVHAGLLPWLLAGLAGLILYELIRHPPAPEAGGGTDRPEPVPGDVWFRGLVAVHLALGVLVTLAVFWPPPLAAPADPLIKPQTVAIPWYFSAFAFVSRSWAGVAGLVLLALVLLSLPWIDRSRGRTPRQRPWALAAGGLLIGAFIWLSIVGAQAGGGP